VIIRKRKNGGLILIGQTDHSRLAGQLAAHWGNDQFEKPAPYESVVRAATFHDYGWLRYETSPQLNPKTLEPYAFLDLPLTTTQLDAYQWSLGWFAGIDRYSGLLVSMHRTGLWKSRYGTIRYPEAYNIHNAGPEVLEFINRNEAWQEHQRKEWNLEQVWINYRLLEVWDILALYFCCHYPAEDHVEPVPTTYSGKQDVRLKMKPVKRRQVSIEPYPFATRPRPIQLAFKKLTHARFEDEASFREAYLQAENDIARFELV